MIRLTLALSLAFATPAAAQTAWEEIAGTLYPDRALLDGAEVIAIDAPYRTYDDARTQIAARIAAPRGKALAKVSLVLDNNPMPVSAVFDLDRPLPHFRFDITMRVNGPTPLHVVAETSDGALYVAETFVKTSGQGACAAPPGTDPELALETLGQMAIAAVVPEGQSAADQLGNLARAQRQVAIDVSHPSHSGMQMDQISLLFIPMRYVETLDIDLDGQGYAALTGSISLSENPSVTLSVPAEARRVEVTMTDTSGAQGRASADLAAY